MFIDERQDELSFIEDEDEGDFDGYDNCGHCGTELSEGWCSVCGEMAD